MVRYNTFFDITGVIAGPHWSFKTDFAINYTFDSCYNMDWIANMEIGLDPNNSVIKRLCICSYIWLNLFYRPTPLILDEEGRTIDVKTGQAVTLTHHAPTLKVILAAITKKSPCNEDPLIPHFYIVKLGFTGVHFCFLIFAPKHKLRVHVRTASSRRF